MPETRKSKVADPESFRDEATVRLSAFTLVDVLAGLVIMSIVVSMIFGVFNMVNKQTHDFHQLRLELNELVLMQADLNRQIDACQRIHTIPSGFVLEKQDEAIRYFIADGQLIRQNDAGREILHPSAKAISFQYEAVDKEEGLITGIAIKTTLRDQEMNAHFFKSYSQAEQINQLLLDEY